MSSLAGDTRRAPLLDDLANPQERGLARWRTPRIPWQARRPWDIHAEVTDEGTAGAGSEDASLSATDDSYGSDQDQHRAGDAD